MTLVQNDCEGTSGIALTTTNSDDSGGAALANVTGTWTFNSTGKAHGNTGWRCLHSTAAAWRVYWTYTSTGTLAFRAYVVLNSLPNAARDIVTFINSSFASNVRISLDATNHFQVKNASGTALFTASAAITAGTVYRIEGQIDVGTTTTNGTINFQYYLADSGTAVQTYASSTVNAGAGVNIIRTQLGANDSVTIDITFDDVATNTGTTTPIGSSLNPDVTVAIPASAFTVDALAPNVKSESVVTASPPVVTFQALAPTVKADVTVAVPTAQFIIQAPVPNVSSQSNVTVVVPTATFFMDAMSPSLIVGGSITISVPTAAINFTPIPPTIISDIAPGRPGLTMQDSRYAAVGGPVPGKTFRDLFVEKIPNVLLAWGEPGDTYAEAERRKYGAQPGETLQDARSRYYHNNDL